jgi:hypothetical protein
LDILDSGINIVQLHPETVFKHERSDMTDIIRAIIELSRGYSESRMKSVRSLANWEHAVKLAREKNKPIPGRMPAWVTMTEAGTLELIDDRATVVRQIYEWAAAGYGVTTIVKKLTAAKVPAFGGRVTSEDGTTRKVEGDSYGSGQWWTTYVRDILTDKRAIGQYQPRDSQGRKKGDPIPNYYPAVVTEQQFYAVRAAMTGRKNKPGRIGKAVSNLFGGLLKNARDGESYYVNAWSQKGLFIRFLMNKTSREGLSKCYSFPLSDFEQAILYRLREIDPDTIKPAATTTEVSVIQDELNFIRGRRTELALLLTTQGADLPEVTAALGQLASREKELLAKVEKNAETVVKPLSNTCREVHRLTDLLYTAKTPEEREDIRLRMRAAFRRWISEIWLLVVPRGKDRLCYVQIYFTDGRRRDYLIFRRSPRGNHKDKMTPARLYVETKPALVPNCDLRKRDHADRMERALLAWELPVLMEGWEPAP